MYLVPFLHVALSIVFPLVLVGIPPSSNISNSISHIFTICYDTLALISIPFSVSYCFFRTVAEEKREREQDK